MSREIKFRVWDVLEKRYTSNEKNYYLMQDGLLWRWLNSFDGESHLQGLPENIFIVEFDTGLKDKNGKEIYEGDIVKSTLFARNGDKGRYKKDGVEEIGYIGFEEGSFKICFAKNKFGRPTSYIRLDDLHWETYGEVLGKTVWYKYDPEVIGTIHENPELLEGEK